MMRLLRFILTGDWHLHRWGVINSGPVVQEGLRTGTQYECRCSVCGKIRKYRV